jgi:hypothetical protein
MGDTEMVEMRLRWFGHMERKEDSDWVKACQWVEVSGKRGRGRDRKTWSVGEDVKALGLRAEDAQERLRWRRLIRGTV